MHHNVGGSCQYLGKGPEGRYQNIEQLHQTIFLGGLVHETMADWTSPLQKHRQTNHIAELSVCGYQAPVMEHWRNVFFALTLDGDWNNFGLSDSYSGYPKYSETAEEVHSQTTQVSILA